MDYKYTGIILSKRDVGETDRIYTIYTLEMGKIRALAKGVRKAKARLAGYLEPITQAEVFLAKTKGLGKITGSIATNNFARIKSNMESMKRVFCAFKILEKIVSEQNADENAANLLREYLETMDKLPIEEETENENKKDILTLGFLFKFLGELGYQVEANRCVRCEKRLIAKENYFSAGRGGVLCSECAAKESQKIKISDESVKLIRIFLKNKIGSLVKINVTNEDASQMKIILADFLNWVFGGSGIARKGFLW
jgi:DNA repair protein RecO (recombination protein O)